MSRLHRSARSLVTACVAILAVSVWTCASKGAEAPHLRKQGTATQLVVGGRPFLILGGELGNSSASDLAYMEPIWAKLVRMNLNTVLAPVYWDRIELEEGRFDFTLVDALLAGARAHDLRLVLLWFGSWKNSMSCYAPLWVKADQERFPRARDQQGKGLEILSPFSEETRTADRRAFVALMRHLRDVDGQQHTVVMVQVENEIGMIPEARDYSDAANDLFAQPVPRDLTDYLQEHHDTLIPEFKKQWETGGFKTVGTWEDVFGPGLATDEVFMAWHFAFQAIRCSSRKPVGAPKGRSTCSMRSDNTMRSGSVRSPSSRRMTQLPSHSPAATTCSSS